VARKASPRNGVDEWDWPNPTLRLSPLQRRILAVLPPRGNLDTLVTQDDEPSVQPMTTGDVIAALGMVGSKATMSNVSHSLARLEGRGLVAVWAGEPRTSHGYFYTLAE
jgi:hypothetical protein